MKLLLSLFSPLLLTLAALPAAPPPSSPQQVPNCVPFAQRLVNLGCECEDRIEIISWTSAGGATCEEKACLFWLRGGVLCPLESIPVNSIFPGICNETFIDFDVPCNAPPGTILSSFKLRCPCAE